MNSMKQRARVVSKSFLDTYRIEKHLQVEKHSEASFCDDLQRSIPIKQWFFMTATAIAGGVTGFLYISKYYYNDKRWLRQFPEGSSIDDLSYIRPSMKIEYNVDTKKMKKTIIIENNDQKPKQISIQIEQDKPIDEDDTSMNDMYKEKHNNQENNTENKENAENSENKNEKIIETNLKYREMCSEEIVRICKKYKIDINHFALSAAHCKPVEFHIQTALYMKAVFSHIFQSVLVQFQDQLLQENEETDPLETEVIRRIHEFLYLSISTYKPYLHFYETFSWEETIKNQVQNYRLEEKKQKNDQKNNEKNNENIQRFIDQSASDLYDHLVHFIVANWENEEYFDPVSFRDGFFGRRHSDQGEGLNVGTRLSTYITNTRIGSPYSTDLGQGCIERLHTSIKQEEETNGPRKLLHQKKTIKNRQPIKENNQNLENEENKKKKEKTSKWQHTVLDRIQNYQKRPILGLNDLDQIYHHLKTFGFVVLRDVVAPEDLSLASACLHTNSSTAKQVYDRLETFDPNVDCRRPTRGRLHCLLRGTLLEPFLVEIQQLWIPIIYTILPTENKFISKNEDFISRNSTARNWLTSDEDHAPPNTKRIFVSDIQLLTSDPLACHQFWHSDSLKPSLSVIVPLEDMNSENGAHEFIPGTHHLHPEFKGNMFNWMGNWRRFYRCYQFSGGTTIPSLKKGDVLIYDARINHRGLKNLTWDICPSIIFRYDFDCYPPPGQKISQSNYNRFRASLLQRLSGIYNCI